MWTIKELLTQLEGEYVDYELYYPDYIGECVSLDSRLFHTDYIHWAGDDIPLDTEVIDYRLMDEHDYQYSVLGNASGVADFGEWYDDKNAKVLCILIHKE